jgi:hypothetical protein
VPAAAGGKLAASNGKLFEQAAHAALAAAPAMGGHYPVIIGHENQRFNLAMLTENVINGAQPHVMLRCCDG